MENDTHRGCIPVHLYVEMQRLMILELRAADQRAVSIALDVTKAALEATKYRSWFVLTAAGLVMTAAALAWSMLK